MISHRPSQTITGLDDDPDVTGGVMMVSYSIGQPGYEQDHREHLRDREQEPAVGDLQLVRAIRAGAQAA